jgi:hypothetical protein
MRVPARPKRWSWPLSWINFSQGQGKAPTVCATVRSCAIGRVLHKRAVIAMKHIRWWDDEADAQGRCVSVCLEPDASGNGTDLPLLRLVRFCDYLDDSSNREGMREVLHRPRGRISLWLAAHAPKTMDSQGRCKRCSACANALGMVWLGAVGPPENWIDDAALASPYWLIDNACARQQPSLEAAREMMRSQEKVTREIDSRLPKEGPPAELVSIIRDSGAAAQYRLYIRTDDGFVPVPDERECEGEDESSPLDSPYCVLEGTELRPCSSLEEAREAADAYRKSHAEDLQRVRRTGVSSSIRKAVMKASLATVCVIIGEDQPVPIDELVAILAEDRRLLARLGPREEQLLRMRFGLERATCDSLEEIAKQLDVTHEHVGEIEANALRKLGMDESGDAIKALRERKGQERQRFLDATADLGFSAAEESKADFDVKAAFDAILGIGPPVSSSQSNFFQAIVLECAYRANLHHRYPIPQAGTISDPAVRTKFLSDLRVNKNYRVGVLTTLEGCSRSCKISPGEWNVSALE